MQIPKFNYANINRHLRPYQEGMQAYKLRLCFSNPYEGRDAQAFEIGYAMAQQAKDQEQ
jgi:hypothetical protein